MKANKWLNPTRLVICVLLIANYLLLSSAAIQAVDSAPEGVCAALANGGYMLDRFEQGRGDVYSRDGNRVAENVRATTISKSCYNGNAGTVKQRTNKCSACAEDFKK